MAMNHEYLIRAFVAIVYPLFYSDGLVLSILLQLQFLWRKQTNYLFVRDELFVIQKQAIIGKKNPFLLLLLKKSILRLLNHKSYDVRHSLQR
jgi:hypothetical protein